MGVTVRRLSAKDAPVAAQVVKSFSSKVIPSGYMVRFLGNPANFLLVVDHNGEVAGFLLAYTLERLKEAAQMVFIFPEYHVASYVGSTHLQNLSQRGKISIPATSCGDRNFEDFASL